MEGDGERRCGASERRVRSGSARRSGACARRRASSPTRVSFILDDVLRVIASYSYGSGSANLAFISSYVLSFPRT